MKIAPRGKKTLIFFLSAFLCLFLTWLALGMPALTPGWAFRRACQASFLPKLEGQTVLTAKANSQKDIQFWLAEKDDTVYVANVQYTGDLAWSATTPLGEVSGNNNVWIVPLPTYNLMYVIPDGPHVAVRASGESAAMALTLKSDSGDSVWDLIPCGEQDGWFLFRYDLSLLEGDYSQAPRYTPEYAYWEYILSSGHHRQALYPQNTRNCYTLRFTSYDAAGSILQEAALEW